MKGGRGREGLKTNRGGCLEFINEARADAAAV